MLAYLDAAARERFVEQVAALPGHWLSVEGRTVVQGITVPDDPAGEPADFVLALDGVPLARVHPHGKAVRWGPPS